MTETTEQMAERLVKYVREYRGVTMAELTGHLGKEAEGDHWLHFPDKPNTVIWTDVSEKFVEAFKLALKSIQVRFSYSTWTVMMYAQDGKILHLPLAKRITKKDFKTPRWAMVILNPLKGFLAKQKAKAA